jgi:hypothetical protein
MPGGLDEQPPYVAVARLGDLAAALLASRGMLTGDQPQEGHEAAWGVEAHEVVELGDQTHGGESFDAPEATKRSHYLGVAVLAAQLFDLLVERSQANLHLLDRQQVVVEDELIFGMLESQASKPQTMTLTPRPLAFHPLTPSSQQQLAQPVPAPDQVLVRVLPGPA